ncbi:cytochrome P450 [Jatrophihabitans endophyticus]|uniref:cytochrome P450 n=1 Tax=Jatrophihabitans endophyticus TaxID=1206085 RepID=UPI0019F88D71|nr:cytochrome P450 [Jatrophihabitans endophyticus]MBE7189511.1 cytochrome P450 [Jatrophihabitans endophyticus]
MSVMETTTSRFGDMPGDAGPPVIGYTKQFVDGTLTTSRDRFERDGPVTWLKAMGRSWVMAMGPDACGEVLQNRDRAFDSGPGWGLLIGRFFRRGLMLLDGAEHHSHRRLMQEAFTSHRLAGYLEPLNETVTAGLAAWPRDGALDFYPTVKQLTLDVATRTFMGEQTGVEADRLNRAFVDCVRAGTAFVRFPVPGLRWSRGLHGRAVLEDYLRPRIARKRAGDGTDLFSALCHTEVEGERFTDADVLNHMIFLLMAAHDTSTITLTTMAYHLAKHPEWQDRARAESEALGTDAVAYDDLERLEVLDQVMKESLRLVVPVPGLSRYTSKDTTLQGYPVPAGTYIATNLYSVHRYHEWWPDPDRFDPGRFSPQRREDKVHRYAFMPFGNGVHKCIGMYFGGMEIKAVMHQLLLKYRLEVPDGYTMPLDWTSLPRPSDRLPLTLHRL